ncbi:unnamed protein product [Spirodela intermedia]|uniref:Uncharacterized protein n=1 Tax=Spirodela intermedia TaxID=51605 RepID=A0A7I8JRQ0_SPIIN|nr:unnamed protein product [Spirodela intermedia]CAA6672451.1 unnamed protein product [Spirodela intermedia]
MTHEDMQAFLDSHGLCASIRFLCLKEVGNYYKILLVLLVTEIAIHLHLTCTLR